jgi:hypothetical protein
MAICPAAFFTLPSLESIDTVPFGTVTTTLKLYVVGEVCVKLAGSTCPAPMFSELTWKPVTGCENVAVTGMGLSPVGSETGMVKAKFNVGLVVGVVEEVAEVLVATDESSAYADAGITKSAELLSSSAAPAVMRLARYARRVDAFIK